MNKPKIESDASPAQVVHTPGDWTIETIGGDIYIQSSPDTDICRVFRPYPATGESGKPEVMQARAEANARLIAAAPELLAALQSLVSHYDLPASQRVSNPSDLWSSARSAITLAGGDK